MNSKLTRYGLYGLVLAVGGGAVVAKVVRDKSREREALAKPACCCSDAGVNAPPEPQFDVPEFKLTERSGAALTLADLKGKIWIADFIYTTCPGPCPMMTARMAALTKDLPAHQDLRFVSFSVDPQHDTPEVLSQYAKRHNANDRWLFVTGPREQLRDLSVKGFRLALGDQDGASPDHPIVHSTRFVLVDREGKIRRYYDGFDAAAIGRLRADTIKLLEEKSPATAPVQ